MTHPVPFAVLRLGLCLCGAALACPPAAAQAPTVVNWQTEAIQRDQAAVALSEFYTTMYNSGQLRTRDVVVEKGDTPTDVMRRAGSWPPFLRAANRQVDALLCDLNRNSCRRDTVIAPETLQADIKGQVGATLPSDGNWRGLQEGDLLTIPDYVVESRYRTIVTSADYIDRRYRAVIRTERTGDLPALYCNLKPADCPGLPPLTWEGAEGPPIRRFDPALRGSVATGATLPEALVEKFSHPKARAVLVAVPILSLRQTVVLPARTNAAQYGLEAVQSGLPANVLVAPQLRLESAEALQALNRPYLDRMMFVPPIDAAEVEDRGKAVTVYHIDQKANLQHCVFQGLVGVNLYEWRDGKAVDLPRGAATPCATRKGIGREAFDHGTHTLGLLVSQLEAFASVLPPSEFAYFNVVHVPLAGSQFDINPGTAGSAFIGKVLSDIAIETFLEPDVVSMSLSWPAGGMDALDDQILQAEDLLTFVVAAPWGEAPNECARGPAGIKRTDGNFAENVLSVVGLNLGGAAGPSDVVILDGAGTGKKCHEIGAFGALVGPVGTTDEVDTMVGASQATPIVAATVAELIRRLPEPRPLPRIIARRLISTGWFDPDMIDKAQATLLDSGNALRTGADLIVTTTGCRVTGTYIGIENDQHQNSSFMFFGEAGQRREVMSKKALLSFRNLDPERVLVVSVNAEGVLVEVGRRSDVMDTKRILLPPESLDPTHGPCDGIDPNARSIPAALVQELFVRKLGD